ncbi:GGDEF domain-containing protein [Amycolatopsis magusensis]|uniref:GGDEF domain-containing protein n=1 Tax=Amycolatopsis magusensis TaxID=882444 RepID=UPI003C2D90F1
MPGERPPPATGDSGLPTGATEPETVASAGGATAAEPVSEPAATAAGTGGDKPDRHPFDPRAWGIWQRPKKLVAYLLVMETIAATGLVYAFSVSDAPNGLDWIRFAILVAGATIHIQLTQRQEERRRSRTKTVLIDLTAVWIFPAVLVVPVPLIVALVVIIRGQRWFTARRPAHNFVFSTISHSLAAAVAHLAFADLGPQDWTSLTVAGSLREFALVVLTAVIYEAIQIIYVGGAIAAASKSRPNATTILGSKADNVLEAVTTGLGAMTAILLVTMPPTVAIMAVVTVVFNRLAELDQLQSDVRTDPKTGLLNMRGWSESAERALSRTSRGEDSLALLMIDLDHFKWINDTFGHPAGDDVLRSVAEALDQVTRPSDVVGRFGGEEFLVLLPEIDPTAAELAAERVLHTIAALSIDSTDKRGDPTTISGRTTSIGVALFPRHGDSLESLLQAADSAVYEAKEGGRNQVRFADGSVSRRPRED